MKINIDRLTSPGLANPFSATRKKHLFGTTHMFTDGKMSGVEISRPEKITFCSCTGASAEIISPLSDNYGVRIIGSVGKYNESECQCIGAPIGT